jgi:hypothetical protein
MKPKRIYLSSSHMMMTNEKTHEFAKNAEISLQKAVREELIKKAKLGQKAVIYSNGKPLVVMASTLVNSME